VQPETNKINQLIQRIVDVANPLKIILFGSAVRGDMTKNSDLDVLVILPEGTPKRLTTQKIYCHLIGLGIPVDIVVATEIDLMKLGDNPSLVYYPALRQGKVIYGH
jgi:predicted nucleotidyltransferase